MDRAGRKRINPASSGVTREDDLILSACFLVEMLDPAKNRVKIVMFKKFYHAGT